MTRILEIISYEQKITHRISAFSSSAVYSEPLQCPIFNTNCFIVGGQLECPSPAEGTFTWNAFPSSTTLINGNESDVIPDYAFQAPVSYLETTPDGISTGHPANIVNAWGGAAWDQENNIMYINGGGHADYCGNGVYGFNAETQEWSATRLPSTGFQGYTASNPFIY